MLAPSCSLLHSPVTLRHETNLEPEVKDWLAFAEEKIGEVTALRDLGTGRADPSVLAANAAAIAARRSSPLIHRPEVKARVQATTAADLNRPAAFPTRQARQKARFKLPAFPTTTIGSFPQTDAVRAARAQ